MHTILTRLNIPMLLPCTLLISAFLITLPAAAEEAVPKKRVDVQTAESQSSMTPQKALTLLKEGNQRFITDTRYERDLRAKALILADGQFPYAAILGCIDSRASHELLFDAGIGDLFSARVAGNFVNTDILGSLEFATALAGAKIIVVLGHNQCGAIKGACDHVEMGNLTHTLSNIAPAVYSVEGFKGQRNSKNEAFVEAVAHANVELTVDNIIERSPVIKDLIDKGQLMVVGAMLDIATGKVTFLESK